MLSPTTLAAPFAYEASTPPAYYANGALYSPGYLATDNRFELIPHRVFVGGFPSTVSYRDFNAVLC